MKINDTFLRQAKIIAIVAFFITTLSSCKRDDLSSEEMPRLSEAKTWYLNTVKESYNKSVESFFMTKSNSVSIEKDILWGEAKAYKLSDGTDITGIPVKFRLRNGSTMSGNYFLLITKSGKGFKRMFARGQTSEQSNSAIASKGAIENLYSKTVASNAPSGTKANGGKVMNAPIGCTDWYLVETTYDEEGNVIDVYIEFLYTQCPEEGSGGGGTTPAENETPDWGYVTDEDFTDQIVELESDEVGTRYFNHYYKWTFHRAYHDMWWARSYEKGMTKKVGNGAETFVDFKHLSAHPVGVPLGKNIEITTIDAPTSFTSASASAAILYKIKKTATIMGTTSQSYSTDYFKSKNFTPAQYEE